MEPIKTNTIGKSYSSGTADWVAINPIDYPLAGLGSITKSIPGLSINNNNNNIMQNKVAVFKVTRDENQKITSTKFIKELWIESKNGSSIDFEVAKDSEISKYEANEIVIKNVYSVTF